MQGASSLESFRTNIEYSINEHSGHVHKYRLLYFFLTATPVILSGFVTIAAANSSHSVSISIASGIAAICIALERSLTIRENMMFNEDMISSYKNLLDGIDRTRGLKDKELSDFEKDWWAILVATRRRSFPAPRDDLK